MDVERFAAELPNLFDDFPRSRAPRRLRFDDILETVPNLAAENNLALVNLAVSLLEPGESYVEAGTFMGASLIAAARGNGERDLVAVDNFSFPPLELDERSLPAASRTELEQNLARFGVRNATLVESDIRDFLRSGLLTGRRVGVYYHDTEHTYEAQLEALRLVEPYLAGRALVVVDNSDWDEVAHALRDYRAEQPRVDMLFDIAGRETGSPQWWDGVCVLAWDGS
jgi:predicted O-methyltransferase YrrM